MERGGKHARCSRAPTAARSVAKPWKQLRPEPGVAGATVAPGRASKDTFAHATGELKRVWGKLGRKGHRARFRVCNPTSSHQMGSPQRGRPSKLRDLPQGPNVTTGVYRKRQLVVTCNQRAHLRDSEHSLSL